jgi:hypothetical protein
MFLNTTAKEVLKDKEKGINVDSSNLLKFEENAFKLPLNVVKERRSSLEGLLKDVLTESNTIEFNKSTAEDFEKQNKVKLVKSNGIGHDRK